MIDVFSGKIARRKLGLMYLKMNMQGTTDVVRVEM